MIKHTGALTLDMQICFYTTNLTFCCMMPALIKLECINNVIFLLQSYTMRNGVLGVMGEILLKVLSKDSLEDKLKDTRDQFLEKLEVRLTAIRAVTLDLFCSYCILYPWTILKF